MLFNSIDFAVFLPVALVLYWFVANGSLRVQNLFLVVVSYLFYGWWDWRFLLLIAFSTLVDFWVGRSLELAKREKDRKRLLWISIGVNLGLLGIFKYYGFFADNFIAAFTLFGVKLNTPLLHIMLPVGISFYTFQTLSYTIDVYRHKLPATKDFIAFTAFVSFFPQLVAGPIERATHLLPQFFKPRYFSYESATNGLRQVLWGLFKKTVIADNCAEFANYIFNNSDQQSGGTLALGAFFFSIQIYADFSGYSDIAIGTARLFGFNLSRNFAYPYFSRDVAEFWRRWHISLTTWFRDYLYIPLGGSRGGKWLQIRNTLIIFLVSGFWHGADWTFIVWGLLNAIYFLPLLLANKNRRHLDIVAPNQALPSLKEAVSIITTFCLITFAWIFFRAENLAHAISYIQGIFSNSLFDAPDIPRSFHAGVVIALIVLFTLIQWWGRREEYAIAGMVNIPSKVGRWMGYLTIVLSIYFFGNFNQTIEFIYFQF